MTLHSLKSVKANYNNNEIILLGGHFKAVWFREVKNYFSILYLKKKTQINGIAWGGLVKRKEHQYKIPFLVNKTMVLKSSSINSVSIFHTLFWIWGEKSELSIDPALIWYIYMPGLMARNIKTCQNQVWKCLVIIPTLTMKAAESKV